MVIRIGREIMIIIKGVSYKFTFRAKLIFPFIKITTFNIEEIADVNYLRLAPITILCPDFYIDIEFQKDHE